MRLRRRRVSRRVKLYAGPIARIRYTASSSIAKFVGLAALGLVLIAAIIGSLPFVPKIADAIGAQASFAGEYVRDTLTVAQTATPGKEDASQVRLRLEAGKYLRASETCIKDAGVAGQRTYALTYAVSQLKEKLGATWLDVSSVTATRDTVMNEWKGVTDAAVWENPSCADIRPATPAS